MGAAGGALDPVLDDLLDEWDHANSRFEGVRVIGNRWSERSYDTTSRCGSRPRSPGARASITS